MLTVPVLSQELTNEWVISNCCIILRVLMYWLIQIVECGGGWQWGKSRLVYDGVSYLIFIYTYLYQFAIKKILYKRKKPYLDIFHYLLILLEILVIWNISEWKKKIAKYTMPLVNLSMWFYLQEIIQKTNVQSPYKVAQHNVWEKLFT